MSWDCPYCPGGSHPGRFLVCPVSGVMRKEIEDITDLSVAELKNRRETVEIGLGVAHQHGEHEAVAFLQQRLNTIVLVQLEWS